MLTQLTAEELAACLAEVSEIDVAGEYGKGYHVSAKFNALTQTWRVYDHGDLVGESDSALGAVQIYNAVRPRVEAGGSSC